MKKSLTSWQTPMAGALLLATAAAAEQEDQVYLNSTNRVSVSVRMGFNITGKFKGVGTTFGAGSPLANPRSTPHGDPYNYDDGYVYPDISGSKDGMTWYWGYDKSGQVNASAPNSIDFHRTSAVGLPGDVSDDKTPYIGFEVVYDRELYKNDDRHLYAGIEGAFNYTPIYFGVNGNYNLSLSQVTDTYGYTPGTTPPSANLPYQGSFKGPGFVLDTAHSSSVANLGAANFLVQQDFDGNLWGFRLGPYLDYMPSRKWDLHLSGGLAVGVLAANASWKETITLAGGGPGAITSTSGGGDDVGILPGFYVGLDAQYKFNPRWSVEAGVQFQDLGTYDHNFGGRTAEVDLSQSVFVHVGLGFSF